MEECVEDIARPLNGSADWLPEENSAEYNTSVKLSNEPYNIKAQLAMRYQEALYDDPHEVYTVVIEKLLHEFFIEDQTSEENKDILQTISMQNVTYTSKKDKILGTYGPYDKGFNFEALVTGRIGVNKDVKRKDSYGTKGIMYRGILMKSK